MRTLFLAILAVLLVQFAAVSAQQQQQQRPQGSIEGMITRQGTGQPVPNAQLRLTRRGGPVQVPAAGALAPGQAVPIPAPAALPPGQVLQAGARGLPAVAPVMADDRGRFVFSGLDEGTYTLQALANGYVIQPYGQRFPNGPGTPITVTGAQATKDINIALVPAANISGRLRDTNEQPLINVPVQLLRYSYDSTGNRTYQSVGATQTNDRGEYRMYWVTPGRYYLLGGRPSTGSNALSAMYIGELGGLRANGNEVPSVNGYAFFPGVTEIANARTIDLQPGADLQSVDLVFASKPKTYNIRGKIVDSRTGAPPTRANVFVATQTPGLSASGVDDFILGGPNQNYKAATGTFEIRGLMPGNYTVIATVMDTPVAGRGGPVGQSSGSFPVSISNSDVDGVSIAVVPAGMIPGRLRIEGQLPQGMTMDRLRIGIRPIGGNASLQQTVQAQLSYSTAQVQIAADGTFRFPNIMPGDYRMDTVFLGANVGYIKEVRLDGIDGLNTPIRFSGSTNNGLEVVFAVGGGRVDGTLTDARSQPLGATRVVIIPDRVRYRPDLYKITTTDASGRFVFSALAPGDYKVFSWESIEEYGWFDPETLARSEARGRAVHVNETSSETIDVRIIPAEGSR